MHIHLSQFAFCLDQKRKEETQLDFISMEEFIAKTSTLCTKHLPEVLVLHAKHIHGLAVVVKEEFQRVLYEPQQMVKVTYLIQSLKHLVELRKMYEDCTNLKLFEEQVTFLFRQYLPELSSISFMAMKTINAMNLGMSGLSYYL